MKEADAKTNYQEAKKLPRNCNSLNSLPAIDYLKKTIRRESRRAEIHDLSCLTLFFKVKVLSLWKRYRTDYYQKFFGEKIFKLPIFAPTVMAQWLTVAKKSLYGIVWGYSPEAPIRAVSPWDWSPQAAEVREAWFIFVIYQYPCSAWGY